MKIRLEFETDTMDANVLGEFLREITFVGEGYGCYSTFDVRADATELPQEYCKDFFRQHAGDRAYFDEDYEGIVFIGHRFALDDVVIEVIWYWDGDGCLVFRLFPIDWMDWHDPVAQATDRHPARVVMNNDCKKSYNWEEVD